MARGRCFIAPQPFILPRRKTHIAVYLLSLIYHFVWVTKHLISTLRGRVRKESQDQAAKPGLHLSGWLPQVWHFITLKADLQPNAVLPKGDLYHPVRFLKADLQPNAVLLKSDLQPYGRTLSLIYNLMRYC